jgi:hypothetical protein
MSCDLLKEPDRQTEIFVSHTLVVLWSKFI